MAAVQSDYRPFSLPLDRVLAPTISSPLPDNFKAAPTSFTQLRPYKSPYSLLSTYGIQSIPSQERMKASVEIRGAVESNSMETGSSSAGGAPVSKDDCSAHDRIDHFSNNITSDFKGYDQVFSIENSVTLEPIYNHDSLLLLGDDVCVVGGSDFDLKPADAENAEQGFTLRSSAPRLAPENANNVGAANIGAVARQRMPEDIYQQEISASSHSNGDDTTGFIDIDALLVGRGESILTTVEPTSLDMAETGDNGTPDGSPINWRSRSTIGSTQGSVLLSDEPMATESNTDFVEAGFGPTARGGSGSPHLADCVNSLGLNVVEAVKDRECGNFSTGSDTHQKNSVIESSVSAHSGSCNHPQPPKVDPAAAHQQPDTTSKPLPVSRHAQNSTPRHARRKHSPSSTSAGLTTIASTISTLNKSTNFEIRLPHASAPDLGQKRQLSDIEDESTDDLNDQDYANHSDASSDLPLPSKRMRRTEDSPSTTYHDLEKDSYDISNQDAVANPSTTAPQSKEIPIRRFLTLKTFESKVIYCFSFSQDLSPHTGGTYISKSGDREDSEQTPRQEQIISSRPIRHSEYSPEDDKLLRHLKEDESLSWDEIAKQFPGRSKGTLQVRYCTKLKRRSGTTHKAKKRGRFD